MSRNVLAWSVAASLAVGAGLGALGLGLATFPRPWPSYAGLFDEVAPTVVNVTVGLPVARVGSGVAVSANEVVTARHLVVDADEISVRDVRGRRLDAELVGSDARADLALLRVGQGGLSPVPLGRASTLRVGDPVVAIGNPYGLGHSLAAGVVGHLGRRLSSEDDGPRVDFVQLSIPLNPGNSGGPVFAVDGELVGVLSGTHAQGQAIAFAVPVEVVRSVLPALRRGEHISRAYLGLRAVDDGADVLVRSVTPHSPADRGGVRPGDRLRAADGEPLTGAADLQQVLDRLAGGDQLVLRMDRPSEGEVQADVTLADWAQQPVVAAGMTLVPHPGLGGEVVAVRPRSRAERGGVQVGDRVRSIDGVPARAPADVKAAVGDGAALQLELVRQGVPLAVQLEEAG